MNLTLKNQLK
jgi:GTPase SAR1 family protein